MTSKGRYCFTLLFITSLLFNKCKTSSLIKKLKDPETWFDLFLHLWGWLETCFMKGEFMRKVFFHCIEKKMNITTSTSG
ncbi:unnamed protein product [Heterobilharzia americana]|nr:unnamed protein product [Heterobilharzia americana]